MGRDGGSDLEFELFCTPPLFKYRRLDKLNQHAMRGLRMKERDKSSSCATSRHRVNEPVPVSFGFRQGLSNVVDSKCDVVDPFASFREESADRTVPPCFQKLQMKIPRIQEGDPHPVTYQLISLANRKA